MITTRIPKQNSDILGALSSGLCLIHCIATPFVFIAKTCTDICCSTAPIWWTTIDYLFIIISFLAVYWSTKHSDASWMVYALWANWVVLCCIIVNEKLQMITLPEFSIYIPALALISLHMYNRKYCTCKNACCSDTK